MAIKNYAGIDLGLAKIDFVIDYRVENKFQFIVVFFDWLGVPTYRVLIGNNVSWSTDIFKMLSERDHATIDPPICFNSKQEFEIFAKQNEFLNNLVLDWEKIAIRM